jgi:hypothetical protein
VACLVDFTGSDIQIFADVHQFSIITELLGTPPDDVIATICSENTLRFVQSLPKRERVPFTQKFKTNDPSGQCSITSTVNYGG